MSVQMLDKRQIMSFFIQALKWMIIVIMRPARFISEAPTFQTYIFIYKQHFQRMEISLYGICLGEIIYLKMWMQQGKSWYALKHRHMGENSVFTETDNETQSLCLFALLSHYSGLGTGRERQRLAAGWLGPTARLHWVAWLGTTDGSAGIFQTRRYTTKLLITYTQCLFHARCFGCLINLLNHPLFTRCHCPLFLMRKRKVSRSELVAPRITELISDMPRFTF